MGIVQAKKLLHDFSHTFIIIPLILFYKLFPGGGSIVRANAWKIWYVPEIVKKHKFIINVILFRPAFRRSDYF